jgi:hypothetical protein
MEAILAILAALAPALGLLLVDWIKRRDDPKQKNRERYAQIDTDIVKGNSMVATGHATDDLDELDRLQNGSANKR